MGVARGIDRAEFEGRGVFVERRFERVEFVAQNEFELRFFIAGELLVDSGNRGSVLGLEVLFRGRLAAFAPCGDGDYIELRIGDASLERLDVRLTR